MMKRIVLFVLCLSCLATFSLADKLPIAPSVEELNRPFDALDQEQFQSPPRIHRPETWFHYIGGNVSLPGITADLEAIAAAGLSGVQLFHGQFGGPWPEVEKQIPCLSENWDAAVRHTALECKRLGLRFTMQNCPGWAMSGGPWIEPANAMRHLVWSRTDLEQTGTSTQTVSLPKPQPSSEPWRDYQELTVLAFPTPKDDSDKPLKPNSIKSDLNDLPWENCLAGDAQGKLTLPPCGPDQAHWLEVAFPENVTLRTVEFSSINGFLHAFCYEPGVQVKLEVLGADAQATTVFELDMPPSSWQDGSPITFACDETVGNAFRVTIKNQHPMRLNSLRLFSAARKNNWEFEAAWTLRALVREGDNPRQSPDAFVDIDRIVDVSDKMNNEGQLQYTFPEGRWTVLRVGHVNTGMRNGPAPPEGTGWECDKLSTRGPNAHFAGYIGRLAGPNGPLDGGLLNGMLLDSWECRTQTWTVGLEEEFQTRTGYPLKKYLPAVFGFVLKDHETSKRFLRDWRGTIGDLFANKFYGRMAELAKENGLNIQYETAAGDIFPADILEYFKYADVPVCEFWQPMTVGFVGSLNFKPIKPTVSAARIYGKPRVSAEAFTSFSLTWDEHWQMLKDTFNVNAIEGVTHCIFHTYTHNPQIGFHPPGSSLGSGIGTPFLRGQTWWKSVPEFVDYLARCCYLLERGKPVSDVLWYLGDEIDHKPDQEFPFPDGYKYDYCNPDVLLHRLSVKDGRIVTPEGIQYRVLWLRDNKRMLPETLEKLHELLEAGATVIGQSPDGPATLIGGTALQDRFEKARQKIWENQPSAQGVRSIGKGKLIFGYPIKEALVQAGIEQDLRFTPEVGSALWLHRQTKDADWYFVCAGKGLPLKGELNVRTLASVCELWDPVTGKTKRIPLEQKDNRTTLALDLPAAGSCFVVLRNESKKNIEPEYVLVEKTELSEPWTLRFPQGWGAPETISTAKLTPWKDLPISDEGKAFSGTVTYSTSFQVDRLEKDRRFSLNLGQVEFIAAVRLNGKPLGIVWADPYTVELADAVVEGTNQLEIEVTSTWFNRLVYDANLPEDQRKTWTISGPSKDSPLRPSGLIGPVVVIQEQRK